MSSEDKIEFEFIERAGSPNKRGSCPSSRSSSRPSSRPIKMWVLFEGKEDSRKVVLKDDFDESNEFDLDDFKNVLRKRFSFLKSAENEDIMLFNENLEHLDPRTKLNSLGVVGIDSQTQITVRYPLSDLSINVNLKFVNNRKEECMIKHTTGSFNMLQVEAKSRFESLADCRLNDIYFEHQGRAIENAYHFNLLVENNPNVQKKEISLDLKVLIRNRKSFSDWKLEEVLKNIYNYKSSMFELESDVFNLEDLPQLSPTLSDEELNTIVEQLKVKESVFENTNTNEATAREFISVILVNAVYLVKKNIDDTVTLMVEKQLTGTHGYGPMDYVIMIQRLFLLVTEAKPDDPSKGIAQNLAQIDTMSEVLVKQGTGKRKFEYEYLETMPVIGIVTTGRQWIFIRHTCQDGSRRLEVSKTIECKLTGNNVIDDIKIVVSYIVRLLKSLIKELEQRKPKHPRVG